MQKSAKLLALICTGFFLLVISAGCEKAEGINSVSDENLNASQLSSSSVEENLSSATMSSSKEFTAISSSVSTGSSGINQSSSNVIYSSSNDSIAPDSLCYSSDDCGLNYTCNTRDYCYSPPCPENEPNCLVPAVCMGVCELNDGICQNDEDCEENANCLFPPATALQELTPEQEAICASYQNGGAAPPEYCNPSGPAYGMCVNMSRE